jgi:hypothetical protein
MSEKGYWWEFKYSSSLNISQKQTNRLYVKIKEACVDIICKYWSSNLWCLLRVQNKYPWLSMVSSNSCFISLSLAQIIRSWLSVCAHACVHVLTPSKLVLNGILDIECIWDTMVTSCLPACYQVDITFSFTFSFSVCVIIISGKIDSSLITFCPVFLLCQIDPMPFLKMCLNSRGFDNNDLCITAVAYLQACLMENTPLRIPDTCVKYANFFIHQI